MKKATHKTRNLSFLFSLRKPFANRASCKYLSSHFLKVRSRCMNVDGIKKKRYRLRETNRSGIGNSQHLIYFSEEPCCWLRLYWLIHRGSLQVLRDPSVQLIRILQKVVSILKMFGRSWENQRQISRIAERRDGRRPMFRRRCQPGPIGYSSHRGCYIYSGVREHLLPHVRDLGVDPARVAASTSRI